MSSGLPSGANSLGEPARHSAVLANAADPAVSWLEEAAGTCCDVRARVMHAGERCSKQYLMLRQTQCRPLIIDCFGRCWAMRTEGQHCIHEMLRQAPCG